GAMAACAVLLVANQFAPVLMADDLVCYSPPDVNCDWVVDGQDLSIVLGSWGTSSRSCDLDGNCTVDGGDLAMLLGSWGALPEMPEWQPIDFTDEAVSLCLSGGRLDGIINGAVTIDPAKKGLFGSLTVEFPSGGLATVDYVGTRITISVGDSVLSIDGSDDSQTVEVDGVARSIPVLMEEIALDMQANGLETSAWGAHTRGMMAHALLFETPVYEMNMAMVQVAVDDLGPMFNGICYAACMIACLIVHDRMQANCEYFEMYCIMFDVAGLRLPCHELYVLCSGGSGLLMVEIFDLCIQFWTLTP
ncbi:MAG: hypothetical protein MK100_09885, partial [Phycisphaerales bacterium]|nr:hypothetical protein [Phycisphaerales bacterium]